MLLVGAPWGIDPSEIVFKALKNITFPKKKRKSSLLRKPNCEKNSFDNFCMKSQIE
jgi:ribosomal protein S10